MSDFGKLSVVGTPIGNFSDFSPRGIETLEKALGKTAQKEYLPMQPGDVYQTYADVSELMKDFDFKPSTSIETGLNKFAEWYKSYYKIEE